MDYKTYINDISSKIPSTIVNLRILRKRGTAPTQAFSDFLTHNEQWNWAENLFFNSMISSNIPFVPVRYGKADKIIAGDPTFKQFYKEYQDELDNIGKRPDVLFFRKEDYREEWNNDVSRLPSEKLNTIVPTAIAGFEVRSSAYLVNRFVKKTDRPFLSFTPKVEDLIVVLKWINTYGVPYYYIQIFFDKIYIISFKDILILLSHAEIKEKGVKNKKIYGFIKGEPAFVIEKNPKNQYKETIHIYLSHGNLLSNTMKEPELIAERKELSGGRLLHYVSFNGGMADIDVNCLMKLIREPF